MCVCRARRQKDGNSDKGASGRGLRLHALSSSGDGDTEGKADAIDCGADSVGIIPAAAIIC
jgi:hypothetical protein